MSHTQDMHAHDPLSIMFLATLPVVIISTVSHLFFQLFVIEIMIFIIISNMLEIPLIMFLEAYL